MGFFHPDRRQMLAMTAAMAAFPAQGRTQGSGGTLRISAPSNPSSLDPTTGGAGSDHVVLYPMFDTLVGFEPETLQARPGLAESWRYPDPKTFVLTIRKGVRFHDGEPLNAAAVKFNLERAMSDARSNIKTELGTVAKIEATSEYEVTLHLKQPDSALPLILADRSGMMSSPKAIERLGRDSDRNPVGTGPMKFVSWNDGESVKLVRNEDYWGEKSALSAIEFTIVTEIGTGVRSVMSGQNDFVYNLRPAQRLALQRAKNITVTIAPTLYSAVMYMNYSRPPLNDQRVRMALNLAIDRASFNKAVMLGLGQEAHTVLPSTHWASEPSVAQFYKFDPDRAKRLLSEAGFGDGIDLQFSGYNDQRSVQTQEVIMEMWAKCGIRAKFTTGALPDVTAAFFTEKRGDGTLAAWTGRPDPSVSFALMFNKESFLNSGRVEISPELTAAILESRQSDDLAARKLALGRAQRLVAENALYIPLVFQPEIVAFSDKVEGYKSNLLGKPKFDRVSLKS